MVSIERCLNQISPPLGYIPGQSHAGDCKICTYNPEENKKCVCYTATKYELNLNHP